MKKPRLIAAVVVCGLVGAIAFLALSLPNHGESVVPPVDHPVWAEVRWPFGMDEWGKGRAFQCTAAYCGTGVSLYIRSKLGSCNCTTGVASDDDLDRMSDFALIADGVSPVGDGQEVNIGWMKGRSRAYSLRTNKSDKSVVSIVFNDHCDMIATTLVHSAKRSATIETAVMEFLNSEFILHWAEIELGI